jgi:ABC-type lipoprotein export system ATPase subunit
MDMIQVKGLTYQYPGRGIIHFPDITIRKGDQCLLLGESGSGKTTLLHVMSGLLRSQQGSITIDNTAIATLSETRLDHFRGRNVGFIFQRNHLVSALSVNENLRLATYLAGKSFDKSRCDSLLDALGLQSLSRARISHLSHGQQQRVAIARALIHEPKIIFADEPTSALDDSHCERVISILKNLAAETDCTLIVATHDHRLKNVINNQITLK